MPYSMTSLYDMDYYDKFAVGELQIRRVVGSLCRTVKSHANYNAVLICTDSIAFELILLDTPHQSEAIVSGAVDLA